MNKFLRLNLLQKPLIKVSGFCTAIYLMTSLLKKTIGLINIHPH